MVSSFSGENAYHFLPPIILHYKLSEHENNAIKQIFYLKPHDRKDAIYHILDSMSKGEKRKENNFFSSACAANGNPRYHKKFM